MHKVATVGRMLAAILLITAAILSVTQLFPFLNSSLRDTRYPFYVATESLFWVTVLMWCIVGVMHLLSIASERIKRLLFFSAQCSAYSFTALLIFSFFFVMNNYTNGMWQQTVTNPFSYTGWGIGTVIVGFFLLALLGCIFFALRSFWLFVQTMRKVEKSQDNRKGLVYEPGIADGMLIGVGVIALFSLMAIDIRTANVAPLKDPVVSVTRQWTFENILGQKFTAKITYISQCEVGSTCNPTIDFNYMPRSEVQLKNGSTATIAFPHSLLVLPTEYTKPNVVYEVKVTYSHDEDKVELHTIQWTAEEIINYGEHTISVIPFFGVGNAEVIIQRK